MKKLLLSVLGIATGMSAFAQLPVSTAPENKNVILEEYTGIHCTYCPDGHKLAEQYRSANPNDVFLINVHTGSYAVPSGSELDFRTSFGSALASASQLAGYPAGSINRRNFPGYEQSGSPSGATAQSRGSWSTTGPVVTAEASYVNVACSATVDVQTRLLTVDVEAYFTGTGAPSSMNINVALTQSNIEGTQTGSSYNPAQVLPNGNYLHHHALRHMLTGQWGDVITTTSMGTLVQKQYTYTLPASIVNIPLVLGDLEIIAFIAEGNEPIITGHDGPITYIFPAGTNQVDLASATNMTVPSNWCTNNVTPEITVTNNETVTACDTFEVSYTLNGGSPVTQQVYTTLAAGANTTISFPAITLPTGTNVIDYSVAMISGTSYIDMTSNNNAASQTIIVMPTATFGTTHLETFESMSLGDETPPNAIQIDPDDIRAYVVNQGVGSPTWDIGGYGASANSYRYDFWAIDAGKSQSIVWEKLDFSPAGTHQMTFDIAYAQASNENDRIQVFVSTDCGGTFTQVYSEMGSTLATVSPLSSTRYYPAAGTGDWATKTINLTAYDGQSEVMIKMTGTSAYGNSAYIDNINISNTNSIESFVNENSISIFPNPTNDVSTISFTLTESSSVTMEVYNTLGELVYSNGTETMNAGTQNVIFDGSELPNGIYFVNLTIGEQLITKKVSLLK
jgi:hypothetical protein